MQKNFFALRAISYEGTQTCDRFILLSRKGYNKVKNFLRAAREKKRVLKKGMIKSFLSKKDYHKVK